MPLVLLHTSHNCCLSLHSIFSDVTHTATELYSIHSYNKFDMEILISLATITSPIASL